MVRTCFICHKKASHILPKAHKKQLLHDLGFGEENLPPKNSFFCIDHFTPDSFRFFNGRVLWNWKPQVKSSETESCKQDDPRSTVENNPIEIYEKQLNDSSTKCQQLPSLEDGSEHLTELFNSSSTHEQITDIDPFDLDDSASDDYLGTPEENSHKTDAALSDKIGGFTYFKATYMTMLKEQLSAGWCVDFYENPDCVSIYFKEFTIKSGTSITKNVFCDWRMRTKACNQNIAVNIAPYTTVSRTMVSWKALIALLGELDDTDVDPAETLSKTTAELINDEFNINSMETCRICIQPATMHAVSLHSTYDKSTVAQMIRFCSGLEVSIDENLPQVICPNCLSQVVAACKIKQTCISSDETLRTLKEEEIEAFPELVPTAMIKSEPSISIFDVDTLSIEVKDEPIDKLHEQCSLDAKITTVQEYEPKEERRCSPKQSNDVSDVINRANYQLIKKKKCRPSALQSERKPPQPSYKCYLCNVVFLQRQQKYEHLKSVHSNDELKCKICKQKCMSTRAMENHVMLHERPELLCHMCHICSKSYQNACELKYHIELSHSNHSDSKFFCDLCNFKTFSKTNIKRHLRTIHLKIKAFRCQLCPDKNYTQKISLNQHMITKHGQETDHICRCCGRKFSTMSALRTHMKSICSSSPVAFRKRVDPNEYREQLGDSDNYRCKICSVIIEGKAKIAKHYTRCHKFSKACDLCHATFSTYMNLQKHIKVIHKKILAYECSFCGKRFGHKQPLKNHENTHTGAKPYGCKFCQFKSGDLSSVSKHQKKCAHNPNNMVQT